VKILIIEDNADMSGHVTKSLQQHGHTVDQAADGRDGLFLAASETDEVIIVDRMLPKLDGLSMVKTLRAGGVGTPILFLTALGGIDDRVEGLNAGGDDYLVKPFAFAELLARITALARRPAPAEQQTALRIGDLEMDLLKRIVVRGGKTIDLQPQEFKLLEYMLRNADRVVTRTMLLENVWHFHFDPQTTVVETHISRLRGKIDAGFSYPLIHTIRGAGYCLRDHA